MSAYEKKTVREDDQMKMVEIQDKGVGGGYGNMHIHEVSCLTLGQNNKTKQKNTMTVSSEWFNFPPFKFNLNWIN